MTNTIINFVLDETGSMQVCTDATISGFNEYVNTLKEEGGNVLFTLTQFNSLKVDVVHRGVKISKVTELSRDSYVPAGMTPLYDAIATTVRATEKALSRKRKKYGVLCVIMTDGEENCSKEFTREKILALIEEKTKDGWTFVYLGANQDAWQVGQKLGMSKGNTYSYEPSKTRETINLVSKGTSAYVSAGAAQTENFFDNDTINVPKQ